VYMQAIFTDSFPGTDNLHYKTQAILKLIEVYHAQNLMCYFIKLLKRKNKITQYSVSLVIK